MKFFPIEKREMFVNICLAWKQILKNEAKNSKPMAGMNMVMIEWN
jgi:hypothetical protein